MFAALSYCLSSFFVTASTAAILSTLSLHDALPIYIDRDEWPGRLFPKVKQLPQNPVLLLYGAQLAQLILQKEDRKSTRLNSSHVAISYAVFCLKKKRPSQPEFIATLSIIR